MAKGHNQKLKLLYLAKIFAQETDEDHALSMAQILSALEEYGVHADRKTIYADLEELRTFGMEIIDEPDGRGWHYYLGAREFELPELKLLVDSVQSARFITDRKSKELIGKLEALVSRHQARQLHRQVAFSGRVKAMNESIYYSVDMLHEAISRNCKVRFHYFQWNVKKEAELRRKGAWYEVSPWALLWDDENYYMVGYDGAYQQIRHYRVDKILHMSILDQDREGREAFRQFDLPRYTNSLFGMFGGRETRVSLEVDNNLAGVMIDRFGKDLMLIPAGPDHFRIHVQVTVSPQFFGWVMALGKGIRIIDPPEVVDQMEEEIRRLAVQYGLQEAFGTAGNS